jgi:hypothetical protein
MNAKQDPAWVVREAWGVVRLDRIRDVVDETINRLREVHPRDLLGRELSSSELHPYANPIAEALQSCCDELRDESGMPDSAQCRAVHAGRVQGYLAEQPYPRWADTYHDALARYRGAAGAALRTWLDTLSHG